MVSGFSVVEQDLKKKEGLEAFLLLSVEFWRR